MEINLPNYALFLGYRILQNIYVYSNLGNIYFKILYQDLGIRVMPSFGCSTCGTKGRCISPPYSSRALSFIPTCLVGGYVCGLLAQNSFLPQLTVVL